MKGFKIKVPKQSRVKRNKMHFEVQQKTKMQIHQDRTKYSRKRLKDSYRKGIY